jgi:hypothetical protein
MDDMGQAPMQMVKSGVPMQRIATDILGELPETENGNKYKLVVSDYFTKSQEACHKQDLKELMSLGPTLACLG